MPTPKCAKENFLPFAFKISKPGTIINYHTF